MSGHVISQGILNLINPGFTNDKMEEPSELVFASFNQDTTSLAVGTTSGYKLYSLTSTDSLEPIYSNGEIYLFIFYMLKNFILIFIFSKHFLKLF